MCLPKCFFSRPNPTPHSRVQYLHVAGLFSAPCLITQTSCLYFRRPLAFIQTACLKLFDLMWRPVIFYVLFKVDNDDVFVIINSYGLCGICREWFLLLINMLLVVTLTDNRFTIIIYYCVLILIKYDNSSLLFQTHSIPLFPTPYMSVSEGRWGMFL